MATRGSGLWDNDSCIEEVPGLIRVSPSKDLWHLLACWGLRLWFGQCEPKEFARAVERKAKEVVKLPRPVFEALSNIAQRPDSFKGHRSRLPEHTAVIGGNCGGYRMEPLFDLPEVRAIAEKLAERWGKRLDGIFRARKKVPFTEDNLVELGALLEFTNVGFYLEPARVEIWKKGFAEMDAATLEDRATWDPFRARVEKVFPMLVAPPANITAA